MQDWSTSKLFYPQSHWDWLPSKIQNHIITLARCQVIHDWNKVTGRDKLLSEIRDYGRLKEAWGHGHVFIMTPNWKPPGYYIYIASYYKGQNWWLGVDCTLKEALLNLHERRMTGEYKGI